MRIALNSKNWEESRKESDVITLHTEVNIHDGVIQFIQNWPMPLPGNTKTICRQAVEKTVKTSGILHLIIPKFTKISS